MRGWYVNGMIHFIIFVATNFECRRLHMPNIFIFRFLTVQKVFSNVSLFKRT